MCLKLDYNCLCKAIETAGVIESQRIAFLMELCHCLRHFFSGEKPGLYHLQRQFVMVQGGECCLHCWNYRSTIFIYLSRSNFVSSSCSSVLFCICILFLILNRLLLIGLLEFINIFYCLET